MSGLRGSLVLIALSLACVATSPEQPVSTTFDGLPRVEGMRTGALYVKPDHGITAHHRYHLNQVLLTYERESNHFTTGQEERMRQYLEDATIGGMISGGSTMASRPGPCTLSMGIGLVDVDLVEPDGSSSSTSLLANWGAVTLVVDLRDSLSEEPLLRYGRRIEFPGGIQWQNDPPPWRQVRTTLDELLQDQRKILDESVPQSTIANTSCIPPDPEMQAGAAPAP